jgi:hypothetical protein
MPHFDPQVGETEIKNFNSIMPKGAGRPEDAPAEPGVVSDVVTAVVRTIRRTFGRRTVRVVVHPSRPNRNRRKKLKGDSWEYGRPVTRVHTHRHYDGAPNSRFLIGNPDFDKNVFCFSFYPFCFYLYFNFTPSNTVGQMPSFSN